MNTPHHLIPASATPASAAVPLPALLSDTLMQRSIATPLGTMQLSATPLGLASARFLDAAEPMTSSSGSDVAAAARADGHLDQAAAELADYFSGDEISFEVPLDLGPAGGFAHSVLIAAQRIPYGRVATYSEIAAAAGTPQAARAAGNALHANPICIIVPCHRVVPREGGLGGYASGADVKATLLRLEGVSLL